MTEKPMWPETTGQEWKRRAREADLVSRQWAVPLGGPEEDAEAMAWLSGVNAEAYVGSRHHTVPRFLLSRWANKNEQVRVFHRIEGRHGVENVRDLAVKDFYTIINKDGTKDSTMESLLGQVEIRAKVHIDEILSPFARPAPLDTDAIMVLAQFAAFQATRTTRVRREFELQAEWYAKTMATGRIPDDQLRKITVTPHQNQAITLANDAAKNVMPFFVCRPLAIVRLGAPLLYMCDEPVVLNAPLGEMHTPDCFMTDEQIQERMEKKLRKMKARRRARTQLQGRVVHLSSTRPTGHGVADEVLLPISPSVALIWGPLQQVPQVRGVEQVTLTAEEAVRFANMANEAMCSQALDWVISRPADEAFASREFPPTGPLIRACDGTNAAAAALNEAPERFRPQRLWTPKD